MPSTGPDQCISCRSSPDFNCTFKRICAIFVVGKKVGALPIVSEFNAVETIVSQQPGDLLEVENLLLSRREGLVNNFSSFMSASGDAGLDPRQQLVDHQPCHVDAQIWEYGIVVAYGDGEGVESNQLWQGDWWRVSGIVQAVPEQSEIVGFAVGGAWSAWAALSAFFSGLLGMKQRRGVKFRPPRRAGRWRRGRFGRGEETVVPFQCGRS